MPFSRIPVGFWIRTAAVSALVLVPLWALLVWDLQRTVEREQDQAELALRARTQVSAQSLQGGLRLMDVLLRQLRDQWQRDPAGFADAVRRMQREWSGDPGLDVSVHDAQGHLAFTTVNPSAVGVDVSDRDPYVHFSQLPVDVLRVGVPLLARVREGKWFIPFSRPILGANGQLLGVVNLLMAPRFLTDLYGAIGLDPDSTVTLLRHDDELVMRSLPDPQSPGRLQSQLPLPQRNIGAAAGRPFYPTLGVAGSLRRASPYDSVSRYYAWQKLPEFNLALFIGRSEQAQLDSHSPYVVRYGLIGLTLSVLVVLLVHWRHRLAYTRQRALRAQADQIRLLDQSRRQLEASQDALRELNAKLVHVREEEGKRIAQEIHDELGQRLTVLRMDVALLERQTRHDFAVSLPPYVQRLKDDIDAVLAIVRDVAARLRPVALDVSLSAAVEGLLADYRRSMSLQCELHNLLSPTQPLDDAVATTAYRVVQEALTNAARHSHAHHVSVRMAVFDDAVLDLAITDDGVGFEPQQGRPGHLGLAGMRERIATLGGQLQIVSAPGLGTTVTAQLPLQRPGPGATSPAPAPATAHTATALPT